MQANHNSSQSTDAQVPRNQMQQPGASQISASIGQLQSMLQGFQGGTPQNTQSSAPSGAQGVSQNPQTSHGGHLMAEQLDTTQLAQIQNIIQQIQQMIKPQMTMGAGSGQAQGASNASQQPGAQHQQTGCDDGATINISSEQKNNVGQNCQSLETTGTNQNLTLNNQSILSNLQAIQMQIAQGHLLQRNEITATQQDHSRQVQKEMSANEINQQKQDNQLNDSQQQQNEGNQPAHNSVLLSNSSQQPQALTGQGPNSSSPPISTVSPSNNPANAKNSLNQDMIQQNEQQQPSGRQFFELAKPQIKSSQYDNDEMQFEMENNQEKETENEKSHQHQLGQDQYTASADRGFENLQEADLGQDIASKNHQIQNNQQVQPNFQQQSNSVNLLMNQIQDVIQEGEQAQNELTHYEEELKTYENQYQSISPEQQLQVQDQVTQSVQILNQHIDNRKMQIQSLQDKYNQLQHILMQKNDQNTTNYNLAHQQQNTYANGQGADNKVYGLGAQQPLGIASLRYQTQQPQDKSVKAKDPYNKVTNENNNIIDIKNSQNYQQMQQITQNIINRGIKTPQTIKESSAHIINQSTPKALVTQSKMFRSQRVGREPDKRVNDYANQQFISGNQDSVASQAAFNNQINYQLNNNQNNNCQNLTINKSQLSLKPEEQINNFLSLNLQQNQSTTQGKGSFNSGGGNSSGVDKGQVNGPLDVSQQIQQQIQYQKPKVMIGQHGAPRVQTTSFSHLKTGNVHQQQLLHQQLNNMKNGPPNQYISQNFQNQNSSQNHIQMQSDFNYTQGQQQTINTFINNSQGLVNLSQQNSIQRQASNSSNQSNGLLHGSHQRAYEGNMNPDMQQILIQVMQQVRASDNLIQGNHQHQLSQSAQRVQELDIANKLEQNLQGLYKLNDQELDSTLNALQQQHQINQQQENLGRKFIEQLTLQAQTKLKQLRDKNLALMNANQQNQGSNMSQQEQLQEIQSILQQRMALSSQKNMQNQNQNRTGQSTQLAQWLSIQEQASILSKKLIQQNSAAILKSASRMHEQQYSSSTGGALPINNSAMHGGSGSAQNTGGQQVQHFQLTDSLNVLKQPSNLSQNYVNHNNKTICESSQKDDHFMNINDLQKNVIAQQKSADCQMSVADTNQINSFQKGPQAKGPQNHSAGVSLGGSSSVCGSKQKETVQTSSTLENVIRFKDREYQFYGKGIISDEQAMEIFDKLLKEQKDPAQSLRTLTQWKDDETHLFQYGLFAYMVKNSKFVEDFQDADWEQIAEIVPTKDAKKCHKRWLFIQKQGGNKTKWNNQEDKILKELILLNGAKDWTNISEKLNEALIEHMVNILKEDRDKVMITARNGKQCRERWLTALDPSIKKSQWTLQEDKEFLEQWLTLGNKWREIANIIAGRTESQVKNRFKLILRREHIQQTKIDPEQLRNQIIPRIIASIKQQISQGSDSNPKSQNIDDNDDSDSGATINQLIDSKGKQKLSNSDQKPTNIMQSLRMIDAKKQGSPSIRKKKAEGRKSAACKEQAEKRGASEGAEDDQEMDE